jgi:hypothetical protein
MTPGGTEETLVADGSPAPQPHAGPGYGGDDPSIRFFTIGRFGQFSH